MTDVAQETTNGRVAVAERSISVQDGSLASLRYERVQASLPETDLAVAGTYMLQLMLRNIATDGFTFVDPLMPSRRSRPGCVLASPSYPANLSSIDQFYVYHWTRDAAITAMELARQPVALTPKGISQSLCDYVAFTQVCQQDAVAGNSFYRACYEIDATLRAWSDQMDGPALENLAFIDAWPRLDAAARTTAKAIAQQNLDRLVADLVAHDAFNIYGMYNLWEEVMGPSFFARSVQLRCLREAQSTNALRLTLPAALGQAVNELAAALDSHWDAGRGLYISMLNGHLPPGSLLPDLSGYDPNIDIVSACVYGAVPCTDPKLLATAAKVRAAYEPGGACPYPVNAADRSMDIGPMIGRYPADRYDGDVGNDVRYPTTGHPWALCTANFAELYYRLARSFDSGAGVAYDELTGAFFDQVGSAEIPIDGTVVNDASKAGTVAQALRDAGDRMLRALIYHSDHYELSEQFDATSGYEKSVTNLTWSYAAYLSAVRAR